MHSDSSPRRFYGVYRGTVVSNSDPLESNRLQLKVPQVLLDEVTGWAWPVEQPGVTRLTPAVDTGVFVMFEGGDPSFPIWSGTFTPGDLLPQPVSFEVAGGTLGTQPTFDGAPLFTGSYLKIGRQVHFTIAVDMDNITSFGTGQYYLNLPFPSKYDYQFASGCLHDISTGNDYPIFGHVHAGESQMVLKSIDAQGNSAYNVPFTHNTPITIATADNFHVSGDYVSDE